MNPVLSVRHLRFEFVTRRGILTALDDISFDIARGEVLGIVGESGAGKSLTGSAIIGLIDKPGRLAGGEIWLKGERIDHLPPEAMRKIRGRRIGMIFQDPLTSLNPLFTVGDQLVETIRTHLDLSAEEAQARALALLVEVGIPAPEHRIHAYPHEFSGGMRQRVVIALALAAEPDLIIADEPTTALDVSVQAQIITLLKRLCRERGTSVMLITHDMGVIAETADRVAVMYAGRIAEIGPVRDVIRNPHHPYAAGLMGAIPALGKRVGRLVQINGAMPRLNAIPPGCAFRPRCEKALERCATDRPDLMASGASQSACWAIGGAQWTESLVTITDLRRWFDVSKPWLERALSGEPRAVLRAVDGVSFDVRRGETFALVGESGSGKSTIAKLVVGLMPPTAGKVTFGNDPDQTYLGSGSVQIIFQDPYASLNPRWTVEAIIAEPMKVLDKPASAEARKARVAELLTLVGLSPQDSEKFPHQFSGGQRQRVAIARALSSEPAFIVCDEPTSALDVSVQAQILNLMHDLQEKLGLTFLFISHNLAVVRHMPTASA